MQQQQQQQQQQRCTRQQHLFILPPIDQHGTIATGTTTGAGVVVTG
jgi:hypothetical protein